jgi:hypothetical protein
MTGSMSIGSALPLNCDSAQTAWARANASFTTLHGTPSSEGRSFSCSGTPAKKKTLSTGAKVGIGLGIGIPALALLLILGRRINKNKMAKEALARQQAADQELEEMNAAKEDMDILPQYNSAGEGAGIPPEYSLGTAAGNEHNETTVPVEDAGDNGRRQAEQVDVRA